MKKKDLPQDNYDLSRYSLKEVPDIKKVNDIVSSLDDKGRWLVTNQYTSNPWKGNGQRKELTDRYASTNAGDETDTSPYQDTSGQKYISTWEYIKNMNLLINYIASRK